MATKLSDTRIFLKRGSRCAFVSVVHAGLSRKHSHLLKERMHHNVLGSHTVLEHRLCIMRIMRE